MKLKTIFLILILLPVYLLGQNIKKEKLQSLAEKYSKSSFHQLIEILSIPNDANFPSDIEKNIKWCENAFNKRKFTTTRIETEGAPLLLAERKHKNSKKTVLIYLQLDGQPVDSTKWSQKNPYQPVIKKLNPEGEWKEVADYDINLYNEDWRVFARSASDAKGPVAMFLASLDAIEELNFSPNYNIKVIMDFEEEMGSPNLPKAVVDNTELLKSDMLIIFDGPLHDTNKPTLEFGARGIATVTLTTYGPIVPQHSGHYGNYAPNPALGLAQLLASMKDPYGRVVIPGYYDGISIDEETLKILRAVPDDEDFIRNKLQLGSIDSVGNSYQEAIQYPSLNIRGMQSGWINEEARTIIPAWARAEIDIRLVLESDPEILLKLLKNHIEKQGYFITSETPTKEERMNNAKVVSLTYDYAYQSFRTNFNTDVGIWLKRALKKAYNEEIIMVRMGGGSVPIAPFVNTLAIPAVIVPTVNIDNNQHSPNENLRIGNYRDGIRTMIAILTEKLE
ncbi:M20/M25/M40 family metallo-hydrolase [uncultured Maribacter sp.]|uniref:M20/M25/M40 family metallo-hydrolase n=1 Tax=uncultured Maribacter sp. TaxID=431308 RepID=UPI0030EC3A08|tara:strand:- start:125735 stop:127252 length:1518 start_codon:yes stop_codon:yes gene_type:complete